MNNNGYGNESTDPRFDQTLRVRKLQFSTSFQKLAQGNIKCNLSRQMSR